MKQITTLLCLSVTCNSNIKNFIIQRDWELGNILPDVNDVIEWQGVIAKIKCRYFQPNFNRVVLFLEKTNFQEQTIADDFTRNLQKSGWKEDYPKTSTTTFSQL